MIGFIGLGAGGSNIADEAAKRDYPAIAINYSQRDLDSLEYVEERLKLVGSEGVGKNRDEAIRLMSKNWESVVAFVQENLSSPSIEVIFVAFSTGGGSGSGMAPILLNILTNEFPEKTFVAVPLLPDLTEGLTSQVNCIQTNEELSGLGICILPVDNEQIRKQYDSLNIPKNQLYTKTNILFLQMIEKLLHYTTLESKNGVMDEKDLHALFATPGVASIGMVDIKDVRPTQEENVEQIIAKRINASWQGSVFAPIQLDYVVSAGIVLNAPASHIKLVNQSLIFGEFANGAPVDVFEGYYDNNEYTLCVILTGLSWYRRRLAQCEKVAQDKQNSTERLLSSSDVYKSSFNSTVNLRGREKKEQPATKAKQKKKNYSDMIKNYRR